MTKPSHHELNHGVLRSGISRKEISSEFESMPLTHLEPSSKGNRVYINVRLTGLLHSFSNTPVNVKVLPLFVEALQSLRNADVIVAKPDKGYRAVITDRYEILSKI